MLHARLAVVYAQAILAAPIVPLVTSQLELVALPFVLQTAALALLHILVIPAAAVST